MKQFEFIIILYTCFLFILRGDLLSFVYLLLLFGYGMIHPISFSSQYLIHMMWILVGCITCRFFIQTPLICQSTGSKNGKWNLSLEVMIFLSFSYSIASL